jgi:hypothetical protein
MKAHAQLRDDKKVVDEMEIEEEEEAYAEEDMDQAEARQKLIANALPATWDIKSDYRVTRDWSMWPSAGELGSEVSNVEQVQYGLMADSMFETIKVRYLHHFPRMI